MKLQRRLGRIGVLLVCAVVACSTIVRAAQNQPHDPFGFLSRALADAGAPALTTAEETQLSALVASYQAALPAQPDAALEAARTAYRDAILAGDLTTADAQAAIIANRTAALTNATLQASAQFEIGVLSVLNGNGQLTALNTRFGTDRVLEIVDSLTGTYSFGGVGNKSGGGGKRR